MSLRHVLAPLLIVAGILLVSACGSSDGGGDKRPCFTGTPCVVDGDCGAGAHCNTSVHPGQCMELYCGQVGAPCDEDAVCLANLVCGASDLCVPPGFDDLDTSPNDATSADTGDAQGSDGEDVEQDGSGDADGDAAPDAPLNLPFQYVRIDDLTSSDTSGAGFAGADIYAIELEQNGVRTLASSMEGCAFGAFDNQSANDCYAALNARGASCSESTPQFVSLGGVGGYVIVSFGREIRPNDTLRVFECGVTALPTSTPETYRVSVGSSPDPGSDDWVVCHANATDLVSCTVPDREG